MAINMRLTRAGWTVASLASLAALLALGRRRKNTTLKQSRQIEPLRIETTKNENQCLPKYLPSLIC